MDGFGTIAVGARMGGVVDPVFVKSFVSLVLGGLHDGDKVLPSAIELPHHWAANVIAHEFLHETECDSVLFIDDDMTFGTGALDRLRYNAANHPYGIVQGLCVSRKSGHGPILLAENGDYYSPITPEPGDKTVEVGMVGLGFTLIRREVFAAVDAVKPASDLRFAWGQSGTGEDAWFCKLARKAGVRIAVDCTLPIGHRVPIDVQWDVEAGRPVYHTYRNAPLLEVLAGAQAAKER